MTQDETTPENATPDEGASAPEEAPPDADPQPEAPAPGEGGQAPAGDPEPGESEPAGDEPVSPAEEPESADDPASAGRREDKKESDAAPGAELEPILLDDERELSAEERARLEAEREEQARLDAAATEEEAPEEPLRQGARLDLAADARIQATGKRKTSVARVVIAPGGGAFKVNRRSLDDYFPRAYHQTIARQALAASGYEEQVDVSIRVHGGGASGQADAVRHGVARALVEIDPDLRGELKRRGMLTRDARAKERRKAGLKKARKRPQFSKR